MSPLVHLLPLAVAAVAVWNFRRAQQLDGVDALVARATGVALLASAAIGEAIILGVPPA